MNRQDPKFARFALVTEMLETPGGVRRFGAEAASRLAVHADRVLLTGEGSSRIFPGKRLSVQAARNGYRESVLIEGALQAQEYDLADTHVFVASNSGKTAEGVRLIRTLRSGGSGGAAAITGIVATGGTPIATEADEHFVLGCGPENAVAATKSVVEQALVYDTVFRKRNGRELIDQNALADGLETVLTQDIDPLIVDRIALAPTIYFAGRNDGVAEELTLKTNEVTRRKSDYLEGTYAVHGIEEVMQPAEAVVVIDPFPEEEEKFHTVLSEGVGLTVVAISSRQTSFPTIQIPDLGELNPYLHLAAGWNVLVHVGLKLGVDLDKPQRARKVGNEYTGGM